MNNGITKQIACQLFAWGYEILEIQSGKKWSIKYIDEERMVCGTKSEHLMHEISFKSIGTDYFILARSTEKLCEEIDGKVPLVECAKIAFPELKWIKSYAGKAKSISDDVRVDFGYNNEAQAFWCHRNRMITPKNQQSLFNHLYSLHFAINLPENTWIKIK